VLRLCLFFVPPPLFVREPRTRERFLVVLFFPLPTPLPPTKGVIFSTLRVFLFRGVPIKTTGSGEVLFQLVRVPLYSFFPLFMRLFVGSPVTGGSSLFFPGVVHFFFFLFACRGFSADQSPHSSLFLFLLFFGGNFQRCFSACPGLFPEHADGMALPPLSFFFLTPAF